MMKAMLNNDEQRKKMYVFLLVLAVATATAFQGWRTLLNNFAVESAGFNGAQMGVVQSLREVPGFLSLLAVYVLLIIREHRLAAMSVLILGAGVSLAGVFPTFWGICLTTLIMSFGFHYYETVNQSLTLQYFGLREAPLVMARIRSLSALTNIIVGGAIYLMASVMGFGAMFAATGAVAVVAGLWAFTRDPSKTDLPPQKKKIVFKRKYWLYYALYFMAGARRQVFVAFAVFLLVEKFGFSIQGITALFMLNNLVNYFVNPFIGRAVNRFGERAVLTLEYGALILIFTAYALVSAPWIAALLYILDNVFFNFSMAIRTYYQKIADPEDIASGMAVGFTITHIVAVVVPVIGGLVWLSNYKIVFAAGAVLAAVSLGLARLVKTD